MKPNIDSLFRPLEAVDNDAIMKVAEKLKKSRSRADHSVAKFLERVCIFREEQSRGGLSRPDSSFDTDHGLQHLQE